jgi:hypothetical protein
MSFPEASSFREAWRVDTPTGDARIRPGDVEEEMRIRGSVRMMVM